MAHNIADIFEKTVGPEITRLADNLYGLELDPDRMMREEYPEMNRSIAAMFSQAGFTADKIGTDFIFPGFDDLFCLLKIKSLYESRDFERIMVDCAPTGETLSLLKLPELLAWYMERFFPVGKMMVRVLSPISRYRYHVNLPTSQGMDDIGRLHGHLMELQELLKNPQISSVRLVCTLEKMVVEETKRSYMYLNLYGYQVDGLFVNRLLPRQKENLFLRHWRQIQDKYMTEIGMVFYDLPIHSIPWMPEEIRGMEAVERMVDSIFTEEYAAHYADLSACTEHEIYEKTADGYLLRLQLPGIEDREKELQVLSHGPDLDLILGHMQRRIPLPDLLRAAAIKEVRCENGELGIYFSVEENPIPHE